MSTATLAQTVHVVRNRPAHTMTFAPDWIPLGAAGLAAAATRSYQLHSAALGTPAPA